jgi:hypothetical protein
MCPPLGGSIHRVGWDSLGAAAAAGYGYQPGATPDGSHSELLTLLFGDGAPGRLEATKDRTLPDVTTAGSGCTLGDQLLWPGQGGTSTVMWKAIAMTVREIVSPGT